jgi:pilus assembly protein CpaD
MIRVIVTRSTASVPSCPDWSTSSDANYNSGNHSNHGCAINSNIAAMIADPEDLVRGRDSRKLDNNSGKKAVDAYRAKTGGN